ncbi:uncharacterized protein LOC135681831 isoform X2 [Rhopilema esculentum]|uniref:uncharacterized protein LOC135681831 isoform X2 n=1 Tax=Rhopilema esculentum TaxID=499914 RepID=UPI0031D7EE8B
MVNGRRKCANEADALNMDFGPKKQRVVLERNEIGEIIQPITCIVDRPAKITIQLKKENTIVANRREEELPMGVSVEFKTGQAQIQFDHRFKGDCQNGTYLCIAEDSFGNRISKEAHVFLVGDLDMPGPRFCFGLQGSDTSDLVTVKSGKNTVLRCSLRDKKFENMLIGRPFIGFYRVNEYGDTNIINESLKHPKFEWSQTKISTVWSRHDRTSKEGSRLLFIENVTKSDAGMYICKINFFASGCNIFKKLQLTVQ